MARHFKNNFSDVLITPQASRYGPQGLVLDLRLPWYRSLPLSVVMPSELLVDDQAVSLDGAWVEHEGRHYPMADLPDQVSAWWFVQDSVRLVVPQAPVPAAGPHEVVVKVDFEFGEDFSATRISTGMPS